ncbi:DNA replication/repair protein RecF [Lachnoclostridium sp. Marseille-P6806]|uniref:DNA replication/repair protein RecF n=1 Tax=Lachnoclostridium sp. Marseille-P6806 TaxID=2364793 RepID=UPI001030C7D5|nr:DNA replication/repair protein RecF [Lachnoclostridium sp. Marseille-P6806]
MFIQSLELSDFRNYERLQTSFSEGTNIICGSNAQGKTNILEALYMAALTKSYRGQKDRDLIRFGHEEAHIRCGLMKGGIDYRIDMHLRRNKAKGLALNGQKLRRASELVGILHIIFFSPDDLRIIKDGPSERRRFMDMELCQLDRNYLHDLGQYNRIVEQRNRLLKDIALHGELADTLGIWDEQIVNYGVRIIRRREEFMRRVGDIVGVIHEKLSGGREHLKISYEPNVTEELFAKNLAFFRSRDIRLRMTTTGPHRDDFSFVSDGIDLRVFGSQGQQRTCALSLKLSEIELVKEIIHDNPVLMLDDVLSELDSDRQNYLLGSIGGIQTFITCTGLDEFVKNRFTMDRVFRIRDGKIDLDNGNHR